jgi:cell division transport system permease protein
VRTNNLSIKQKKAGSYPYLGMLLNITVALCISGILGLLLIYSSLLNAKIKEDLDVKVYLKSELSEDESRTIFKQLSDLEFIRLKEGKPSIRFLSKEDAAQIMVSKTGEEFRDLVGNPLPDTYYLNIKEEYYGVKGLNDDLKLIQARIESIDGVREVEFEKDYIDEINENFSKMTYIFLVLAFVFFGASVVLIYSAIRLALFSQRFLIRSMQLVGATELFIQKPFLIRIGIQGLIAGVIASGVVFLLADILNSWIEELSLLQDTSMLVILFVLLLIFGVLVSVLSAYLALNKFLKMSLDELY